MEAAAGSSGTRRACAHCGLPVTAASDLGSDAIFCCHACRLVALVIGKQQQGEQSWNLLRLGFGTLLAMNIMMISLLLYSGGIEPAATPVFRLVLLALAIPSLAILLPPFLNGAVRELRNGKPSLDALIACGSVTAFSVSAYHAARGAGEIYFDTATMLPVLVTLGKIIEASAKTRAADLLHALESLLPKTALCLTPAGSAEVAIESLREGDRIRVRPGERVAVDGRIREGSSTIEEAAFTGEFLPRLCRPGDQVFAGTINGAGTLVVQAERTGSELLLHGIIALVDQAWRSPSRAERIAERAATLFIPALLVLAAGAVICWAMLGNAAQGMLSALSVLVVACPCTMGIATPLATSLAIARAARAGIIVRGGSVMERMAQLQDIYFDKTGTITTGQPTVREIVTFPGIGQSELLGRLAALESAGGHVLGRAVVGEAKRCGWDRGSVSEVRVEAGSGLSGSVTWQGVTERVTAGSPEFVRGDIDPPPTGCAPPPLTGWGRAGGDETARSVVNGAFPRQPGVRDFDPLGEEPLKETAEDGNCTVIDVAWGRELRGRVFLGDALRGDAASCVRQLERQGISSILLSGDRFPAAAAIAVRAGIARVEAPRNPAQKLLVVADSMAAGRMVAMVGDGINDAPALAAAQTGIALGAGTDLAKQAGNVVILSGQLTQIPWLIALSKRTGSIIRGNFAWSFGYNAVALGAAAAGLLHPLLAALAMVISSLTVLGNSLRVTGFAGPPPHCDDDNRAGDLDRGTGGDG